MATHKDKGLVSAEERENLFLCRPCAEHMKELRTVSSVHIGRPARDKGTCEQCCRRRYGYHCEVVFREI